MPCDFISWIEKEGAGKEEIMKIGGGMIYSLGTKVILKDNEKACNFLTSNVELKEMIKHGGTVIASDIQEIVGHCMIGNDLIYVVEYTDNYGAKVALGFYAKDVILYNKCMIREF